ncbi:hypothetical protein GCM10022239_20300 [Leifsonia bigeumensis]|uniref:Sec-independent protein translocase protein TatA n=1 Tax=Leifsonella bigeumensis TaxID=433643 RepID=A0ABP7FP20_9MICO
MFAGFTGWHALIILVVVVLLFGATKLPALAKSVGQSMKIFRSEMKTTDGDDKAAGDDSQATPKP